MIRVFQYENGVCEQVALDDMDFHKKKWIDCFQPSSSELQEIADATHIPLFELKLAVDEFERPKSYALENFSVVFLKVPTVVKEEIRTSSLSFVVSENLVVSFRLSEDPVFKKVLGYDADKLGDMLKKGGTHFFVLVVEKVVDEFFSKLGDIEDIIDKLEDEVFEKISQNTIRNIFEVKKTLIYFHKALLGNRDAILSLEHIKIKFRNHDQRILRRIYEDFVELLDIVSTYRDILTGSLDIYLSNVSNNLNTVMKRMTAVGSLVLVPTFITGLFGMNFQFFPELEWKYGYLYAWGLIIGSVVVMYTYFKKKGWLG